MPLPEKRRRMVLRRQLVTLVSVLGRGQTYRNLLYLLAAFPLGLTYFVVLITGLSTGFGTAIIGVGVLLLLATMGLAWELAAFERRLIRQLLRVDISPVPGPRITFRSRWTQIRAHLSRPVIWKSLAYLFAEFPFGIVSFCMTVILLSVSAGLILYPLAFVIDLATNNPDSLANNAVSYDGIRIVWRHAPLPLVLILDGAQILLIPALGIGALLGSLQLLNGMARGWGRFAHLMLGMSAAEQHLAEAQRKATHEQARAERADQRRRELIINVSHELRTPIANIRGHVESLRMPLGERLSDVQKETYLGIVARETERLGALVDDLLALARADTDELHLELRPVAVGMIVEEVYQALAPLAHRDRQVTLVRNIAPDLPNALADRDRLAQVLLNLARNAITATPVGGLVFLDLEQADDAHLALTVSDTGKGIHAEDLGRIFERFYRADAARTRATGEFGLGLSIVRELVQAMGGVVSASSTVGAGSCFRVLLSVAQP